jgi:phytoene dehydrogenase-like protein
MTKPKMIIIGAGVAGLTAGIYAQLNGFDSEIYEMHTVPGGECTGWQRKEYYFDGCIHWLMGSKPGTPLNKVWREVGALDDTVGIINNDILYCVEEEGRRVYIYRDVKKLETHFKEIAPEDASRITELCKAIRAFRTMSIPLDKPYDMMNLLDIAKLIMPMLPAGKYLKKFETITIADYAAEFQSSCLQKALMMMVPPVFKATALIGTLASLNAGDSGWPAGGSLKMAKRMEQRYLELGGKVLYRSRVDKILVDNGKATGIQLASGEKHQGDYVISTADGHATLFDMLEGKYLDDNLRTLYTDRASYPTYTTVQVSMGVNCDISHYPHMIYFRPETAMDGGGKLNEYMGFKHYGYDPTLAPQGKSVIVMMLNADFKWWENVHRDREAYQREKERIATQARNFIEQYCPETKGKIEVVDVATPMTYVRYCNAWEGVWMAWATTPQGKIRYIPGSLPGLANFYLSGQWTMPPGGLPVAVITGRWVIQRICSLERKKFRRI